MSRGLSKQQRRILAMLKTQKLVGSNRGYFSTQEVVVRLNADYGLWLAQVKRNPWGRNKKHHIDYSKFDKIRMSTYRALRSLEDRGLIVSFSDLKERNWAIPERLKKHSLGFHEMNWVKEDRKWREARSKCWKWGAFIRTLPKDLHLKYKLRITTKEEIDQINKLWKEHCDFSSVRRV